jgi:hypothetical protein
MRRYRIEVILVVATIIGILLLAVESFAETDGTRQAKIARAMQAAPASISKNATIVDTDGTVLRAGSNSWHCFPASGPGSDHPMCNDAVWMSLMDAFSKKGDFKTERIGISYMLAGDDNVNNADPFDKQQDPGETWVQEGPHLMIIVPDPKMLEGVSDDPENGGPYVMWKGTPYVHIMVPVGPRHVMK